MSTSAYISRRLNLCPTEASAAISAWHRNLSRANNASRFVRLPRGLWLATEPDRSSVDPLRVYAVPGVLWVNGRPLRIELEFTIWSSAACEAAIRPSGLAWPVHTERYARRVTALIEGVVDALVAPSVAGNANVRAVRVAGARWLPVRSVA
jgi:hypothetical protein